MAHAYGHNGACSCNNVAPIVTIAINDALYFASLAHATSFMKSCLCSGAQKLQSFNMATGGPVMSLLTPKMDTFLSHVKDLTGIAVPLEKVCGGTHNEQINYIRHTDAADCMQGHFPLLRRSNMFSCLERQSSLRLLAEHFSC